jgi:hypothetical protein
MTSAAWRFIGLFHNVPLEAPVETEHMAVVPSSDFRLKSYLENADFRHFVTAFRDQFGRRRQPSALLARGAVRRKPESVLAFRNALAISAVTKAWERFLGADRQLEYFKYSGYFDLYPHYLSHDYSFLIVNSPSLFGVDLTKEFHGQTAPELCPASSRRDFYDSELFAALIGRWRRRHLRAQLAVEDDEALFRSLEMAYRAARIPMENRGSLDDYGANLALWASAMEILVWPARRHAQATDVLAVLRPAVAAAAGLRNRRYDVRIPGSKKRRRVTLMEKLYCEIHDARNAFLHGNPVADRTVHPSGKRTRLSLLSYAPVLYKCALYSTLNLWKVPPETATMEAARHQVMLSITAQALLTATRKHEHSRRRGSVKK